MSAFAIRPATPNDTTEIHQMVRELAEFEKLGHEVAASPDDLATALFTRAPKAEALVAEDPASGKLVGFALFFPTYSTFTGKSGLWLEDLFVRENARGSGLGTSLLKEFLNTARQRRCGRAEWSVLEWNEPAISLYRKLGAEIMPDWRIARVKI